MSGVEPFAETDQCPTCGPTSAELHPRRPGVTRCTNCKEWLSARYCARCGDCYHPSFGPNTDGDPCPWCRDCGCHEDEHVIIPPGQQATP